MNLSELIVAKLALIKAPFNDRFIAKYCRNKKGFQFLGSLLNMARMEGVEPPTAWFVARYSIQLSYMRVVGGIMPPVEKMSIKRLEFILCKFQA